MHLLSHRTILAIILAAAFGSFNGAQAQAISNPGPNKLQDPAGECGAHGKRLLNSASSQWWAQRQLQQASPGQDSYNLGGRLGNESPQNQSKMGVAGSTLIENADARHMPMKPIDGWWSTTNHQHWAGKIPFHLAHRPIPDVQQYASNFAISSGSASTALPGSGPYAYISSTGNVSGGGGSFIPAGPGLPTGLFSMVAGTTIPGQGLVGKPQDNAGAAVGKLAGAIVGQAFGSHPEVSRNKAQSNASAAQGSRASSAGEDSVENESCAFDSYQEYLINVANEEAGAACSSTAVSKTYANVVYMVMQMYKSCYLPMAILFLLPGAIITQVKALILNSFMPDPRFPDPDRMSPFIGIFRSIIAIFLIPATQLAVSYCIDIGNSLEDSCRPYVDLPLISVWCEEQIQILSPDQQGNPIKNLPQMPQAAYRGKFAGMPVGGAQLEQMGDLDVALMELVNECYHMMTMGLCIISAFQLVLMCYLFLLGPLAAAFFAWPSLGRSLFKQAFSIWLDAVVILALWKFWWNVTLVCMTVRLQTGAVDPYNPFEVYYLIAFFAILLVMPFNPFDFHAAGMVQFIEAKAGGVVGKVAQGGKSQGGKNSGKSSAKTAKG
jgi:hypothetical protein